jgi:hypothetical protein
LPKKKLSSALPLISANNIGTTQVIRKDYKKNKVELLTKYTPIGIVEDFLDPSENNNSKFSLDGKTRHI